MKRRILCALLLAMGLAVHALAGTNPSRGEVFEYMKGVGREYQIPPEILMGVADQESGLRQFYDDGRPVISGDNGIGMMQVTPWAVAQSFDENALKNDWKYNVRAGAIVLLSKWEFVKARGNIIGNGSPMVLEHWYLALWAYNGFSYQNNPNLYVNGPQRFCNQYICWTRYAAYQDEVLAKIRAQQVITVTPIPSSQLPASDVPAVNQKFATPLTYRMSVIARQPSPSADFWTSVPGMAQDIGITGKGQIWVTGVNQHIYKHVSGSNWAELDGAAVRIAAGLNDEPWVVNSAGNLYKRISTGWVQMPGDALDVGVGANGSVWKVAKDGSIYQLVGATSWTKVDGNATRVAVGPEGMPWVINGAGNIYRRSGSTWVQLPGQAKDIGIGANGKVWVIGMNDKPHYWTGSQWNALEAQAKSISVKPDGTACIIDMNDEIFCQK